MKIAPSILAADFGRLAEEVKAAEAAGADWIHVDVMDGSFVPNITIGPAVTAAVRAATTLPVDVHLMIDAPERHLEGFADAGADRITVHAEACRHLHRALERIRELGASPGVAVNPGTPLEAVVEVLPHLDLLLVMTVNPGFGGQRYIPTSTGKIRRARALLDSVVAADADAEAISLVEEAAAAAGRGAAAAGSGAAAADQSVSRAPSHAELQVDGGVDAETLPLVARAGASVAVAGSAVFRHPGGVAEGIRLLRTVMAEPGALR